MFDLLAVSAGRSPPAESVEVTLFKSVKKQKWFNLLGGGPAAARVGSSDECPLDCVEADFCK